MVDKEQLYLFVDKSGHCFENFQTSTENKEQDEIDKILNIEPDSLSENGERVYRDHVGAMMRGGHKFTVGDMLVFKEDLEEAGFVWGVDFYVKKV